MRRAVVDRPLIGWREWVALPDLDIRRVKAKVDTGARTSALHAVDIERFRRRGVDLLRFVVYPQQRNHKKPVHIETEMHDERLVRSSNGESEYRPVVATPAVLHGEPFDIEITLTSRGHMGFRMLLGRQAVRRRFVVDPGRSYLSDQPGPPPRKKRPAP